MEFNLAATLLFQTMGITLIKTKGYV